MKKYFLLTFFVITFLKVNGQFIVIPDTNFLNRIYSYAPSAVFGNTIDTTDATLISIQNMALQGANIYNLSGIEYFDGLLNLNCSNNHLTTVPAIWPPLIFELNISGNQISTVNNLPSTLTSFICVQSGLTTIDSLPNSLYDLLIGANQLSSLPSLPSNLFLIDCSSNLLDSLPPLPNSLQVLACPYNPLQCLPILPDTLEQLYAQGTNITCLPNLPSYLGLSDIGFAICDSTNTNCNLLINSVLENEKYFKLEIFPNPATNDFIVKYFPANEKTTIEIIDVLGKIVYPEILIEVNEYIVHSNLLSGVYFVKVKSREINVIKKLIIE